MNLKNNCNTKFSESLNILLENDLKRCEKFLLENKEFISYNKETMAWYINDEEILDELWYNQITYLHPKLLINSINNFLKKNLGDKYEQ